MPPAGSTLGDAPGTTHWPTLRAGPLVCHNDVELSNVVFRDGIAVALIDFEFAAPGRPAYDLAQLARLCVPIDDEVDRARVGWRPADRPARLRLDRRRVRTRPGWPGGAALRPGRCDRPHRGGRPAQRRRRGPEHHRPVEPDRWQRALRPAASLVGRAPGLVRHRAPLTSVPGTDRESRARGETSPSGRPAGAEQADQQDGRRGRGRRPPPRRPGPAPARRSTVVSAAIASGGSPEAGGPGGGVAVEVGDDLERDRLGQRGAEAASMAAASWPSGSPSSAAARPSSPNASSPPLRSAVPENPSSVRPNDAVRVDVEVAQGAVGARELGQDRVGLLGRAERPADGQPEAPVAGLGSGSPTVQPAAARSSTRTSADQVGGAGHAVVVEVGQPGDGVGVERRSPPRPSPEPSSATSTVTVVSTWHADDQPRRAGRATRDAAGVGASGGGRHGGEAPGL